MKLVVLSDNRTQDAGLETEHGLSIYLETDTYRYLLDTGCSNKLIRNAERLGVDLRTVDVVFISHAHVDHTGGLIPFLQLNDTARIVLAPAVTGQHCYSTRHGDLRDIGLPFDLSPWQERLLYVDDALTLGDSACFFSCKTHRFAAPTANKTLWMGNPESIMPDTFDHELVACFGTDNPLLFIGCAHKGVQNIVADFTTRFGKEPAYVFGGFHLLDADSETSYESLEEIHHIGKWLAATNPKTQFITGHCTGDAVFGQLKQVMGSQVHPFYTGLVICTNT